jgi:hypothetical protein
MAKLTLRLRLTLPGQLAARLGLGTDDALEWAISDGRAQGAGEVRPDLTVAERLVLFDAATQRVRQRAGTDSTRAGPEAAGPPREALHERGRAD